MITIKRKNRELGVKWLAQAVDLFARKRVCNEPDFKAWLPIVLAAHDLGYLYCGFNDMHVDLACIAYRTEDFYGDVDKLPKEEKGNTLYVCAAASNASNRFKFLKLLKWYVAKHDIARVALAHRNSQDVRVYNVRRNKHGKR